MADGNNQAPTPNGPVNWDQAEAAALQYYVQNGMDSPEALRAVKDRFNVYRAQNTLTQRHADAVAELFLDRKRIAGVTATSITEIGKLAGTSHVQSQQKVQDGATSIQQLAASIEYKWEETKGAFGATVSGFFGAIGRVLSRFSATAGIGEFFNKIADAAAPDPINTSHQMAAMQNRQASIRYDASTSSNLALSVLNRALLMTDPTNVGMAGGAIEQVQAQQEAVAQGALTAGTRNIPPAGASAAPPTGAAPKSGEVATVADLARMSAEIISRAKGNDVKIDPATAQAVLEEFRGADKDGNKKLNGNEVDVLRDSKAYDSLSFDQRKIIDKVVQIEPSLKDKALAVLPGYTLEVK